MYPEYLYNNDTQEIRDRVCELAVTDEPALRARCQEVSRQTDTSSLALQEDCAAKLNAIGAVFSAMANILEALLQSLGREAGIFGTQNRQSDFEAVCHAVTHIEEERLHLLSCITDLTQMRRAVFSAVAEANRALHFLSLAGRFVPKDAHPHYAEATEHTKAAHKRLTSLDATVREAQNFYMTFTERHLPTFMEHLRAAADFNHAGAALDKRAIRMLCKELFVLLDRTPNVSF